MVKKLSDIDRELLWQLKQNARITNTELADRLGISRTAVMNHIKEMEKSGIIKGYEVKLNANALEDSVEFVINASMKPEYYEYFISILKKNNMIFKVFTLTGDCKVMAFGIASNTHELNVFYGKIKDMFKDMRYLSFDIITSTDKDTEGRLL